MHSAPLTEELIDRTQQMTQILEELFGWQSRWNGVVTVEDYALFSGAKRYDCSICIRKDIAHKEAFCWRTLLHEALHAFSSSYSRQEYSRLKGWEEGTVEKTQRLLRSQILMRLNVTVDVAELYAVELDHPYNSYIAVLEQLCAALAWPEREFCILLLQTPLAQRAARLEQLGVEALPASQHQSYRRQLLRAQAVLTRG